MQRYSRVLILGLLATFGAWGCTRPAAPAANVEKVRALEEQLRTASGQRDALTARVQQADREQLARGEEIKQLQAALQAASRERDETLAALKLRTSERDLTASQYEGFRKSLKDLLAQTEHGPGSPRPLEAVPTSAGSASNSGGN